MKIKIFIVFIVSELIVLVFLFFFIYKKNNILGVSVNIIKKNTIDFPNSHSNLLKNYYEPKPNQQQKVEEKWLNFIPIYSINSDTLNEIKEYPISKDSETFRIITIGDSYTFGQYVNTKDNWTELLEVELNSKCTNKKYEVINLGAAGHDLAYTVHRYLARGEKYNPDLVIYLLKDDDFSEIKDITGVIQWQILNNFKSDPANEDILKNGTLLQGRQALKEAIKELRKYYSKEEVIKYQLKNLSMLINTNRKLLIMNIFSYESDILSEINKEIKGITNVVFEPNKLQIKEIYKYNRRYNYLPFDGHPNSEGHILIMNKVRDYLIKNKLVPCN